MLSAAWFGLSVQVSTRAVAITSDNPSETPAGLPTEFRADRPKSVNHHHVLFERPACLSRKDAGRLGLT